MEAVTALLAKLLEAGEAVPDDVMLHRMMVLPSHGTGAAGRVDLKVNAAGRITGGSLSTSIQLPVSLHEEVQEFMFASAHVARDTGCFSFPVSLAREVGFTVIHDDVLLASVSGEPIVLHVSLKPPVGTPLDTVLSWMARIQAASTGRICATKAAAEPIYDGAVPQNSPLLWKCQACSSFLPIPEAAPIRPCTRVTDPLALSASASESAAKLLRDAPLDVCEDPSHAWGSIF